MQTTLDMLPGTEPTTIEHDGYEGCWAVSGTLEIVVDDDRMADNPINRRDPRGLKYEVTFPVDGKPVILETTSNVLSPDEIDKIIEGGKKTLQLFRLPGKPSDPGGSIARVIVGHAKAIAAMECESRFYWVRLQVDYDKPKWYLVVMPDIGDAAELASHDDLFRGIKIIRDRLIDTGS